MATMIGQNLINGSMVNTMQTLIGSGDIKDIYYGYFNFSDHNDFSGRAQGNGIAGKLGLTYKVNDELTVGATYHSKTDIGDLTGSSSVTVAISGGPAFGNTDVVQELQGHISVRDFQWPAIYGAGLAWQARPDLMIAADIKRILWADVMENFRMSFTANNTPSYGPFANKTMNATLPQNWDDQTVIQLGIAYQLDDKTVLRAGFNGADNPIPDSTVNYLFPAIVENHYTFGIGRSLSNSSEINFAMSYAPEVKVTDANNGITITHEQSSWQLMYSHLY